MKPEAMTHTEFSRKGGLTMSAAKRDALIINAAKARAAKMKLNKDSRRMKRARAKVRVQLARG